jgi:PAS domain S-box-containing protein
VITPLYSDNEEFLGVVEVQHDVTQLVNMQEGLEESRSRLLATMNNVPDAIFNCDSEWVIRSCNQAAQSMFNGNELELVDKKLTGFFTEDDIINALNSETSVRQQTILKRVRGKEFPAEIWIGSLEDSHGQTSYIVVVHDISERIKYQQELETARQQYFHQDKMAAIGQLAAGILHEVGNPIAAISGAAAEAKLACDSEADGKIIGRNLGMIDEQITRLGKITHEISDFASPKPSQREMLDLNGLLKGVASLLGYDRRFSTIGFDLQLDKNLPAIVAVNDQLTQVFMNLLINAMDAYASLDQGIHNIVLKTEIDGDRVHISVRDHGCGMSKQTLEKARDVFYTTKAAGLGTGLGLSLCDTIVSAHGGELVIESEEGKGTLVHVYLPVDLTEGKIALDV